MNVLLQAVARGDPRAISAIMVFGSLILYVAGANIAWYNPFRASSRPAQYLRRFTDTSLTRALYEIRRLVFYVGVPYVALYLGWVDLRAMGLGFLDWSKGLRWGIVLALATWSLLMFVWIPYLRATSKMPIRMNAGSMTWSRRVVEVVYMQAHWAFYRAACILVLTTVFQDDLAVYWGTSAGIALIFLEAWADPRVRRHIAQFGDGEPALWSAGQAIINTAGFVLTRNVWLLALIHLALEFSVPHFRAVSQPAVPRPQPSPVKAASPR
jgi:hypothetical protein